jgi:putative IMPACT (imprinted ancient) family translation regulator
MRQALFKCETPRLKLKSSRSFLAIKRLQWTKSKKVIKHLRSSKLRWAHICTHSRIPVNSLPAIGAHERQVFEKLLWGLVSSTIFVRC